MFKSLFEYFFKEEIPHKNQMHDKISIKVNNEENLKKIAEYFDTENLSLYMCYIPAYDISVSPLCLEMHYLSYDDNRISCEDFVNIYINESNVPK